MVCAGLVVYRRFNALLPLLPTIKIVVASTIVFICVSLIQPEGWIIPPVYLILIVVYILLLLLAREIDKTDWQMLQSLFKKNPQP
jgi:predicted tellurium resistance membrane protein TerC